MRTLQHLIYTIGFILFLKGCTPVLDAQEAVRLRVTPAFQFAPGFARLTLLIEPDKRNREYCLIYEGPVSGSTCRELAGDKAERTRWVELKDLPAGEYVAQVKVGRNDGSVTQTPEVRWEVLESVSGQ